MQQHPIPRQITTFEFKLIGQLTIRQAIYLAIGTALGVALFFLIPSVFYINVLTAALPLLVGVGFAFVPVNERPMEIWVSNLVKRLTSPTQYYFHKKNKPPQILLGVHLPPKEVLVEYIRAKQQLSAYEENKSRKKDVPLSITDTTEGKLSSIHKALQGSEIRKPAIEMERVQSDKPVIPHGNAQLNSAFIQADPQHSSIRPSTLAYTPLRVKPLTMSIHGTVQNENSIPLSHIVVYIKKDGHTIRIMKTNDQGYFENAIPLPKDEYVLEADDPHKKYSFARMTIDPNRPVVQVLGERN